MKNLPILFSLAFCVAGCSSAKKSSKSNTAVRPAGSSSSPKFLNNITINGKSSNTTIPPYAGDAPAIPGMTVELSRSLQFKYAILLDVPVEEVGNLKLIESIDSWYGTRYRYGGSDRNGVDCSGFSKNLLYAVYGLVLPRTSSEQYEQSKRVKKTGLSEGDLVFFKTQGAGRGVSHVGVYLRNNKFVHASTSGGVMISDLAEAYYTRTYAGAGRVRE